MVMCRPGCGAKTTHEDPPDQPPSEHSHRQTGSESLSKVAALRKLLGRDGFGREDRLGGLCMRTQDQRVLNRA